MRKIYMILLVEAVIFVLGLVIFAFATREYDVCINYIYESQSEFEAINTFEYLNYSRLTNISPFVSYGGDISYDEYVYPQYINRLVVDFYIEKVYYLKRKLRGRYVLLNYTIISRFSDLAIVNISMETKELYVNSTKMDIKMEIRDEHDDLSGFAILNESGVIISIEKTMTMALKNVYIVYGVLSYDEIHGSLAGYGFRIRQLVILDSNFSLILVACLPTGYVI